MVEKINDIIRQIEDIRTFSETDYLKTNNFVIFPLFGGDRQRLDYMTRRSRELLRVRKACGFFIVDDVSNAGEEVGRLVEGASRERVDVESLNEIHICPVIFSDAADCQSYAGTLQNIDRYLNSRDFTSIIKPILIMNTSFDNKTNSNTQWLEEIEKNIRGTRRSCRCCILTTKDDSGWEVAEERLIGTMLFTAFLSVSRARHDVGNAISYFIENPDKLFYTAQSAFVSNPIVSRTLSRMKRLLELYDDMRSNQINMNFMEKVLDRVLSDCPQKDGVITLMPLFGVMPDNDLEARLDRFIDKNYLGYITTRKESVMREIGDCFMQGIVRSGAWLGRIDTVTVKKFAEVGSRRFAVEPVSEYPDSSSRYSDVYWQRADDLRKKLTNLHHQLLEDYLDTTEFKEMPRRCEDARKMLVDLKETLNEAIWRQMNKEIRLNIPDAADESWINEDNVKAETFDICSNAVVAFMSAETDQQRIDVYRTLIQELYDLVQGTSGLNDMKRYMELVESSCSDQADSMSSAIIQEITENLKFPIKTKDSIDAGSMVLVWSKDDSNVLAALEYNRNRFNLGPLCRLFNSGERLALLHLSAPFVKSGVMRVSGAVSTEE